jgi:hypothetical protein
MLLLDWGEWCRRNEELKRIDAFDNGDLQPGDKSIGTTIEKTSSATDPTRADLHPKKSSSSGHGRR